MPRQAHALSPHHDLPKQPQKAFFLMASAVHARAERVHVVQHLGVGVQVFHVFCTTHKLAINQIRLRVFDDALELSFGLAVGEPGHLKRQFRRPGPHHAPQLSQDGGAKHVDVLGERTKGVELCLSQGVVLEGAQRQGVLGRQVLQLVVEPQLVSFFEGKGDPGSDDQNVHEATNCSRNAVSRSARARCCKLT